MNAVQAWSRPAPLEPTPIAEVDAADAGLRRNAARWVATGIEARLDLLRAVLRNLEGEAAAWIAPACKLKGIGRAANGGGQAWLSRYRALPRRARDSIKPRE